MRFRTLKTCAYAAALAAAPMALNAAVAATPSEVHPGMSVVDPSGGSVGLVTGVNGDTLILKTDKYELALPMASFTASEGKLLFGMTAAQLNAQAAEQAAANSAAIAAGAQVFGSDGSLAGTVEAVQDALVTIKLAGGQAVQLAKASVRGSDKGVVLGVTTAKINEMAAEAAAPDAPSEGE
jgi:preprotein translocase subunit YajC